MVTVPVFRGNGVERAARSVGAVQPVRNPVGEAIGDGLQGLGRAGVDYAEGEANLLRTMSEARMRQTLNEGSDFIRDLTETGENAYYNKQGGDALEGRADAEKAITSKLEEMRTRHSSGLEQRMFEQSILPMFNDALTGVARHARAEVVPYAKQGAEGTIRSATNSAILARNPKDLENYIGTALQSIEAKGALDGFSPDSDVMTADKAAALSDIMVGQVDRRLAENDYEGAAKFALENQERFLGNAWSDTLNNLRTRKNQLEVQHRRAQAETVQIEKDFEDATQGSISQGIVVPEADVQRAIKTAEARGDESKALRLKASAYANRATASMSGASVPQVSARLADIEATKDWRTKPELVMEHNSLDRLRTTLQNKPPAFAPLDIHDAKSIERRRTAAYSDQQTRSLGAPRFFDQGDVSRYQQEYQSGPNGRLRAAAAAAAFRGADAATAARQIAPNDAVFIFASALDSPTTRELALNGQVYLSTNPELNPKNVDGKQWIEAAAPALRAMGSDFSAKAKSTALAIAATTMAREGITKPTTSQFQEHYAKAVHLALGGTPDGKGGVGTWHGEPILLPPGITQNEFDARLSRIDAQIDAHYSDGSLISMKALRRDFTPELIGGGLFRFRSEDGKIALKRDGTPALIDINRVPPPSKKPAERPKPPPKTFMDPGQSRFDSQRDAHKRGWIAEWLKGDD